MGAPGAFHRDTATGAGLKLQQGPMKIHLNGFLLSSSLPLLVVRS